MCCHSPVTLGKCQPRNEAGGGCWSSLQLGGTGLSLQGTAFITATLPSSTPWGSQGSSPLFCVQLKFGTSRIRNHCKVELIHGGN